MRYLFKVRGTKEKLRSNNSREVIIPVLSLALALATIASNVIIAQLTASRDYKLKQYEITNKLKCDYYSNFHKAIAKSSQSLINDEKVFSAYITDLEGDFFRLEPLLNSKNRLDIKNDFLEYTNNLKTINNEIKDTKTRTIKIKYINNADVLTTMFVPIGVKEAVLIEDVYSSLFNGDGTAP